MEAPKCGGRGPVLLYLVAMFLPGQMIKQLGATVQELRTLKAIVAVAAQEAATRSQSVEGVLAPK